jgi:nucleotide-binding universal stress UspA family protein
MERLSNLEPADESISIDYLLADGVAAEEIVHAAVDHKCDLIVMGTHGRSGLGRLVMGSVAEEVMRKAPCPVLTLKAPVTAANQTDAPQGAGALA